MTCSIHDSMNIPEIEFISLEYIIDRGPAWRVKGKITDTLNMGKIVLF